VQSVAVLGCNLAWPGRDDKYQFNLRVTIIITRIGQLWKRQVKKKFLQLQQTGADKLLPGSEEEKLRFKKIQSCFAEQFDKVFPR
jgi:hypothetical protein